MHFIWCLKGSPCFVKTASKSKVNYTIKFMENNECLMHKIFKDDKTNVEVLDKFISFIL